jgi:hypothetical protein
LQIDICTIAPNDKTAYDSDTSEDMRIAVRTMALKLEPLEILVANGKPEKGSKAIRSDPGAESLDVKRQKTL